MRLVTLAVLAALAVALAGCGGGSETTTVTVSGPTVTETTTVTETVSDDEDVARLAEDLCREYGPLARTFGGLGGSDEEVAEAFSAGVDPELREATRRGCLRGLAASD